MNNVGVVVQNGPVQAENGQIQVEDGMDQDINDDGLEAVDLGEELNEEPDDDDKENIENVSEGGKTQPKKSKKRRLQDLHPVEEDDIPCESETSKAISVQSRVVQYLKVGFHVMIFLTNN